MARVTGIGGVFLRSQDPKVLAKWYSEHLGIKLSEFFTGTAFQWSDEVPAGTGQTTWSPFPADTKYFGDGPQGREGMQPVARAVPAERQRHHGTQHGNRAQQVDRPEAASIAVSVVDRALIELPVRLRGGLDQRLQRGRRSGDGSRRQRLQMCANQQYPLDDLMQRHGFTQPAIS